MRARAKLTDFDSSLSVQQQAVRLDIPMDDALTMQVSQTFARLVAPSH